MSKPSDGGAFAWSSPPPQPANLTSDDADFRYGAFITHVIQFVAIAAAVFFFIVKPTQAMLARRKAPVEEGMPDEERRHLR